jgi:hypothetical protein
VPDQEQILHIEQLRKERRLGLSTGNQYHMDHGVAIESRISLSMRDFHAALYFLCNKYHQSSKCDKCIALSAICSSVTKQKVLTLSAVWKVAKGNAQYTAEKAKRLVLQAPVTVLKPSDPADAKVPSNLYIVEKVEGSQSSYNCAMAAIQRLKKRHIEDDHKKMLQDVLTITTTDAEKELVKFVASAVFNGSRRKTASHLGISQGTNSTRAHKVHDAIQQVQQIDRVNHELMDAELRVRLGDGYLRKMPSHDRNSFDSLERTTCSESSDSGESDMEEELAAFCKEEADNVELLNLHNPGLSTMKEDSEIDHDSSDEIPDVPGPIRVNKTFNIYPAETEGEKDSLNAEEMKTYRRTVDKYNARKRAQIKNLNLLSKNRSQQEREISRRHPDIGLVMERYAELCDVGADQWRRTGVLTFNRKKKMEKRLTYENMQAFLQKHYGEKISLGTVVQLCAKKHKRRHTSRRYKGVAKIMYRRAWKGYTLKLNPDSHWSRAYYGLLKLYQANTEDSVLFGRDDQSGVRLGSTYTNKQYGSLGTKKTVTTRTDFVGKRTTVLQVTSYNFPQRQNYPEMCIGVVKASMVHEKSPSQHMADLLMLEADEEVKPYFANKDTEYVQVDGASDEGPGILEVMFLWTERHMIKQSLVTMVTTRCSGDSFLNRVELQNGHLGRAASNFCIPTAEKGEPVDENGEQDLIPSYATFIEKSNIEMYILTLLES